MGLMLSLLVTCVGVLEALACWRHFRAGYLPLPAAGCADAAEPPSSSSDSGSVRSLGAYYCSDESVSKYGLTPMLSEHRRKQPNHTNGDDDADAEDVGGSGSGGGCGREGHCGDVSGCADLVLDTLPTIQELAQEPEEETPAKHGKDSDDFAGLKLHENHFSLESTTRAADNASEVGAAGNSNQRRDILDENENISGNWSVGEHTSRDSSEPQPRTKPRPPQLHYKAPTGDEDSEPQEFRTIRSPPKGTVDRVFTVEEIRGGVSETNLPGGIFSSSGKTLPEERSQVTTYVEPPSPLVKDADRHSEPQDLDSRERDGESETETQRMSRASQTWAEADALFQKRSPSRSPHRSPQRSSPKKLPKNVDISWPCFTPQPLFRRASGTPSTAPAQLWPPAADRRRASSGDVSTDLADASQDKPFRSSSVGPRTRHSTEPVDADDDCLNPWNCGPAWEREGSQEPLENGRPSTTQDTKVAARSEKQSDVPSGRRTEESGLQLLEQDIPYSNMSTKTCHSITEPTRSESMPTCETKNQSPLTEEGGGMPTTSVDQAVPQNGLEGEEPEHCDSDDEIWPPARTVHTAEEELELASEAESATKGVYMGDEKFAVEKSQPRKKHKRSVRISSFEREDEEKAQQKSRRSEATEQWSDEESSQGECSASSQAAGAGEPFWVRTLDSRLPIPAPLLRKQIKATALPSIRRTSCFVASY